MSAVINSTSQSAYRIRNVGDAKTLELVMEDNIVARSSGALESLVAD